MRNLFDDIGRQAFILATSLVLGILVFLVVFLWGKSNPPQPLILALLAGLTVVFVVPLMFALLHGDGLTFESRWGGFGGGLGGWRVSTALGLLFATLFFGCLTFLAAGSLWQPDHEGTTAASQPTDEPSPSSTTDAPGE